MCSEPENLTPQHLRCAMSASCPGVWRLQDGRIKVIGPDSETGEERAVILPEAFFDGFKARSL